uniref:Protein involved in cellulose biosynthesis (CelD) n=1 Tax=Desulfovibrio sp. U5L TaxID=596152 RepID=I2Q327_9BACT
MVTYELIETVADLPALSDAWPELLRQGGHTPFQEWSWHRAWWEHLGPGLGQAPFFMTAWEGGRLRAVVPLAVAKEGSVLQWSAAEVSDYCDVVQAEGAGEVVAAAMDKAFSRFRGDAVRLRQLRPESRALAALAGKKRFSRAEDVACPHLVLHAAGYAGWVETANRKDMADANRLRRRLGEIGEVGLAEVAEASAVAPFVGALIADKREWLDRRGAGNLLCSEAGERFLADAAGGMPAGMAHPAALTCGGEGIARYLSFVGNGRYHYYLGSWNYAWKRFAPGRLLMLDLIRWAHENGCREFDLLRGEEAYKDSVATGATVLSRFEKEVPAPGRVASLLRRVRQRLCPALSGTSV